MYVVNITIPLAFHADSDAEANVVAHKLADHYARLDFDPALRTKFSAEVSDAPQPYDLSEILPYEQQREVKLNAWLALKAIDCEENGHRFNDLGECLDCDIPTPEDGI